MELNHLRRFYEVAKAGGFTRAARAVRAQQPALSRAVSQLEHDLGVTLLDRGKRSVTLTKVGREVYAVCDEMFVSLASIRVIAERERTELEGVLSFGATSELASDAIPDVCASLVRTHPAVWPMAFVGPASSTVDDVARGAHELALFFHLPRVRPEISVTDFAMVPFRLVVAAERARDRACLESFVGSREIDDQATRQYPTLAKLRARHPAARIRFSSNDAAARRALVLRGAGVSVLPWSMVAEDLRAGRLVELLRNETLRFPLQLVTRRRRRLSRIATELLDTLRAWLERSAADEAASRKKPRRRD